MKKAKRNHLGLALGFIKLVTAVIRLAYWLEKLLAVTANYLRRRIENQQLYSALLPPEWQICLRPRGRIPR